MAEQIKALYSIAQKDVYSVMETAWGNFDTHQAEFEDFKGLYKVPYSSTAKTEIVNAKALPDNEARSSEAETLRIAVKEKGLVCLNNFQRLKRYIVTAFPNKAVQKPQNEAAGDNYYEEAANEDWESMQMMNQSAMNYLSANQTILTAGDNMPASFETNYTTASDEFSALYASFKLAEQTSETTATKIKATNDCFVKCMDMLKDAQVIFSTQPDVKTKFVFQNLVDLINPTRAGLKGIVKDNVSFEPLAGAQIGVQKPSEPIMLFNTDIDGKYSIQLGEGNYTVNASATGYVSQSISMVIEKGSFKTLNFELVKE